MSLTSKKRNADRNRYILTLEALHDEWPALVALLLPAGHPRTAALLSLRRREALFRDLDDEKDVKRPATRKK